MKKSGFDYAHPDDVEPGYPRAAGCAANKGHDPVDKMSAEQALAAETAPGL